MKNHTIAIYSDDPLANKDLISKIIEFLKNKYEYSDFTIISNSNNLNHNIDISIIPNFYLKFFTGGVVFLNIDDYLLYADNIMSTSTLYLETKDIATIDKEITKNTNLLTNENNNLKLIKKL
jgi:hypothetical protein